MERSRIKIQSKSRRGAERWGVFAQWGALSVRRGFPFLGGEVRVVKFPTQTALQATLTIALP